MKRPDGKTTRQVMEATGYARRGWVQQLHRRYNTGGPEVQGGHRHQNPVARKRALLDQAQRRELAEALRRPPEDGGMWNSRKVGEWIEQNRRMSKDYEKLSETGEAVGSLMRPFRRFLTLIVADG